jgi:hypothetical protein
MSSVPRPPAMAVGIVLAAALVFTSSASAATFTVNDSGDASDANTSVSGCATAGNVCTLRAAMEQAEAVINAGPDTIQFSLPDPTIINMPTNLPPFQQDVTIIGPGADKLSLVSTSNLTTLLMNNGTVSISGMTITGGQAQQGGGIYKTGGDLTLDGVVVSGNKATFTNAATASVSGAGIHDFAGSLTIKRSTVSGNTGIAHATSTGNAIVRGSGIYSSTTLTVEQSLIVGNSGLATAGGTANAAASGGGIYHQGFDTFVLKNSTVSDNSVDASGGAFPGSVGGGVYSANDVFTATSDTVAFNGATINTNAAGALGGNLYRENGPATVRNTIISGSTSAPNCGGVPLTDGGFNLVSTNDCPGLEAAIHANPILEPVAGGMENGGPTKTFKLMPGSPGIDQGKNFVPEPIDQRGSGRPSDVTAIANAGGGGDGSDIGAYEASTSPLTVTTSGTGTGNVSGTGIDCGGVGHTDCAESYLDGTSVALTAAPAGGSSFSGWSGGGCSGTGGCGVTANAPLAVNGTFALLPVQPPSLTVGPIPGPTGARAAALKKCRKKHGAARKRCKKKATKLPV